MRQRNIRAALCIVLFAAYAHMASACEMGKGTVTGVPSFPECPNDIKALLTRAIGCQHFGGEIGGDGSERDQQVNAQMEKMSCDTVARDVSSLKKTYRTDSNVLKAIKETYQAYGLE